MKPLDIELTDFPWNRYFADNEPYPWSRFFPAGEKPDAVERWMKTQSHFFDYIEPAAPSEGTTRRFMPGYQTRLRTLANKHQDRRCFIIGNGPSLREMDLTPLKDEITIGSNGIYNLFQEWGFHVNYYTMEDTVQVEDRRSELSTVNGPVRIFGLDNAYCVNEREDTLFANLMRYSHPFDKSWWKDYYPGFSIDFASVVYLGSTVTYMNLQLAFYLGCNPVYLIGIDHQYGDLGKLFPPGKIEITPDVLQILEKTHFKTNYHKLGGHIGVPYVKEQEKAYQKARDTFTEHGRSVLNAGINSNLHVFEKIDFRSLI